MYAHPAKHYSYIHVALYLQDDIYESKTCQKYLLEDPAATHSHELKLSNTVYVEWRMKVSAELRHNFSEKSTTEFDIITHRLQ